MKKIQLVIIALLTMVGNAMAEGKVVYRSSAIGCDCTLEATHSMPNNDSSANVEIYLNCPDSHQFFAFQMFIVLNEGITLVPDEEEDYGEYVIIPSDRFGNTDKKKAKYGIQIAKKGNGYQIVCLNQQGNAILEQEGLLLTIPVRNVPQGQDIIGEIKEIEFTTLDGKAIRFNPEETGILPIYRNGEQKSIYNLNGQRVESNYKGLQIHEGKKTFNK